MRELIEDAMAGAGAQAAGKKPAELIGGWPVHSTWRAVGRAFLVCLAIGGGGATAQDDRPGRETFAKMIAFARLASVACEPLAPDVEDFFALALLTLVKPPLTQEEISAQVKDVKQLRGRLGFRRWCQAYAGEMEQARILVEVLRKQD